MAKRRTATKGIGGSQGDVVPANVTACPPAPPVTMPGERSLRVFAFDPSLTTQLDMVEINEAVLRVPWDGELARGPVGEYVEVVDFDPASKRFYYPIDLNDPHVLAQDGLPPSEGDPRFHQQMVYAVAMRTITNFENELGRRVLWSERDAPPVPKSTYWERQFVRRLRIYPHALREPNAYYSPAKKALLFGYFPAASNDTLNLPGGMVFTCLSHDVVVHETTHAILDGIHPRYALGGNLDMHAFHEAFADIIALFQHFQMPEVLRHQIRRTRGDLTQRNFLAELAVQFGEAIGARGALRSAIGWHNPATDKWEQQSPTVQDYERHTEPHARGAVLVAAVFDAFVAIYRRRTPDLVRLATGGAGVLPAGELHPDLVKRLADEASKAARHVLRICIRAIDFCPPVDLTFGDFLRALITADIEADARDNLGYRVAFIEGFRRRGILPRDVRSLSPDSLRWEPAVMELPISDQLRKVISPAFRDDNTRRQMFMRMKASQLEVHRAWVQSGAIRTAAHEQQTGLILTPERESKTRTVSVGMGGRAAVEVHAVRPAFRVGVNGRERVDLVVELTQQRRGYMDVARQAAADAGERVGEPDFIFRGGCTLLVDYDTGVARYSVRKNVASPTRMPLQAAFEAHHPALSSMYGVNPNGHEPFAMMHRGM